MSCPIDAEWSARVGEVEHHTEGAQHCWWNDNSLEAAGQMCATWLPLRTLQGLLRLKD